MTNSESRTATTFEWQPIETAPKDESLIFVCRFGKEAVPSYNCVFWNDTDLGNGLYPWCFAESGGGGAYHINWPTHWMPCEPPTGAVGDPAHDATPQTVA